MRGRFALAAAAIVMASAAFGQSANWNKSITTTYWTQGKDSSNLDATLTVACDEVPGNVYKFCHVEAKINCLTALVSSPHENEANDVLAQVQFDDAPLKLVVGKADRFSPIIRFVGEDAIWFLDSMNKAKKARIILSFSTRGLNPQDGVRSGIFEFNVTALPQVDDFLRFYYATVAEKPKPAGR